MHLETKYPIGGEEQGVDRLLLRSDLDRVMGQDIEDKSLVIGSHLMVDVPGGEAHSVDAKDPESLAVFIEQTGKNTFEVNEQLARRAYIADQVGRVFRLKGQVSFGWIREVPSTGRNVRAVRPFTDPNIMN